MCCMQATKASCFMLQERQALPVRACAGNDIFLQPTSEHTTQPRVCLLRWCDVIINIAYRTCHRT